MINNYTIFLNVLVSYVELILNTIAISIVLCAVVVGSINQYKGVGTAKHYICKGISDALNYNLATEVLKIIVGCEIKDLVVIGGILVLKAMITGLFMLEMKQDDMREAVDKKIIKKSKKKR